MLLIYRDFGIISYVLNKVESMKKLSICFSLMTLVGLCGATAATGPNRSISRPKPVVVSGPVVEETDLKKQIMDIENRLTDLENASSDIKIFNEADLTKITLSLESRLKTLERKVQSLEVIVTDIQQGSNCGGNTGSNNPGDVEVPGNPDDGNNDIVSEPKPGNTILREIQGLALDCYTAPSKERCLSKRSKKFYGIEPDILKGGVGIASIHKTIPEVCRLGCAMDNIYNWPATLKIGVITNSWNCTVLPFYDVDHDNRLTCMACDAKNKSEGVGSVCAWDEVAERCTTARVVCTQDGYCSSIRRWKE